MNIEQFKEAYKHLRDIDLVEVDILCNHPNHIKIGKQIAKGPAKRNILKHGGKEFICRECYMKHDNPMNHIGENRQTDEEIIVFCPHFEHKGNPSRVMKKSCYYGTMEEPYLQTCKSCAQLGKEIPEEQREQIRQALLGVKKSDEFKENLSNYMKNNPEGIARGKANLVPGAGAGWNEGLITPDDVRQKISQAHIGKIFTDEHCQNISDGRKKMLDETGGFTKEHRENISKATIRQYQKGFDPRLHHIRGWHESAKAGRVFFRSSYEKKCYMKLDEKDNTVLTYQTECVSTEYLHPKKQINSSYLIDILVEYIDGSKKLIEVKPAKWLTDEVVQAKILAGHNKAAEMGITFEVWTELELFGAVYNYQHIKSFVEKLRRGEI